MPYITEQTRHGLKTRYPINSGELNYVITNVLKNYLSLKGEGYQTYNDIRGAMENAMSEFYRRKIAPYEDKKILENGDIY
jgi:predicted extracellular nuclease